MIKRRIKRKSDNLYLKKFLLHHDSAWIGTVHFRILFDINEKTCSPVLIKYVHVFLLDFVYHAQQKVGIFSPVSSLCP